MAAEFNEGVDVWGTDVAAVSDVRQSAISNITNRVFTTCFMDEDVFNASHKV